MPRNLRREFQEQNDSWGQYSAMILERPRMAASLDVVNARNCNLETRQNSCLEFKLSHGLETFVAVSFVRHRFYDRRDLDHSNLALPTSQHGRTRAF